MTLAGFIYLFMLLNVFIIQIINAGSDDIDLELRLGLPTSMNDAKANKAEQSQEIALRKSNKKIPKDPGNRERKRRRRGGPARARPPPRIRDTGNGRRA